MLLETGEQQGRTRYPPEFRRRVLDLIESAHKTADVARDLGVSQQIIYTWRRQDRIDRGLEPGATTADNEMLTAANMRIREIEPELEIAAARSGCSRRPPI
jgi:transposase-like protein